MLQSLQDSTIELFILIYDWVTYLGQYFKKIPQIKTYHHFRFDKEYLGTVFFKQYWNSEEKAVNLIKSKHNLPRPSQLPTIVNPQGIRRERAEYLFKEIREFCRDGTEDLVAPKVTR